MNNRKITRRRFIKSAAAGAAIDQQNLASQLQADITFKQQEVANTRQLFGQGVGLATTVAGLF